MKKTLLKYFTVALITISTISMPLTVKAAQKVTFPFGQM